MEAKMINRILIGMLITLAALVSLEVTELAQSQLFDQEKSREDIETMRAILTTTLNYALKGTRQERVDPNLGDFSHFTGFNRIEGYYLYGQGALFTISLAPFPAMASVSPVPPAPPEPPAPPAPPLLGDDDTASVQTDAEAAKKEAADAAAQAKRHARELSQQRKELDKKLGDLRKTMNEQRKQQAEALANLKQQMASTKTALVETIAKYGDSLSVVKPQEYITIVIAGEGRPWFSNEFAVVGPVAMERHQQFVSVQKSVVTDYKAGRISLDEFKRKVISYTD